MTQKILTHRTVVFFIIFATLVQNKISHATHASFQWQEVFPGQHEAMEHAARAQSCSQFVHDSRAGLQVACGLVAAG